MVEASPSLPHSQEQPDQEISLPRLCPGCLHCPVVLRVSPHHRRVASLPTSPSPLVHRGSLQSRLRGPSHLVVVVVVPDRDRGLQ